MWSQIVLCLLVGLALASNSNPAWRDNQEYVYRVRGRTLAALHEVSNDYSGIFLKAKLILRPQSNGVLDAKIVEPQYASVHANLAQGWETIIPDSELAYQELPISRRPFQIVMENGAVRDLIVSKETTNWEANMIKSIVSQFQLDTKAENLIPSHINILPQDGFNTAVFKTMEETVTGVAETLYEIHPLPEYVLQTKPWLASKYDRNHGEELIEVVKSKNHTRAEQRPAYNFGLTDMEHLEPNQNEIAQYLARSSVSRAVIIGNLQRFTVQSAVTVDQIIVRPTMDTKQTGSVNSMLNVTLLSVQQPTEQFEQISNPVNLRSLVYRFDKPYSHSNTVRPGHQYQHESAQGSAEAESYYSGEQDDSLMRNKRSLYNSRRNMLPRDDESASTDEEYYYQEQPKLSEAPQSPLLPFTVGFEGQSLKNKQNIVENVRKLAQQMGQEFEQLEKIPEKNTIGKFVILSSLLRIMDQSEMQQVASQLYTKQQEGPQAVAWFMFRDAVAECGTGPALINIKEWIETKKIRGQEAAEVVAAAAHNARQPTEEYMKFFFQMIKSQQVLEQPHLNQSTILAYTRLAHDVYVNQWDSHNKYPVHSFGRFRTNQGKRFLKNEVISYLTQQLNEAITNADTEKIHVYIRALGNVGHQRILEAFEPYLEGRKQASQFQRVLMVIALDKLTYANPKVALSVLYKIYQNVAEYEQVRIAAVYQLMRCEPSVEMLQRMASFTNADTNEYVNAAVKSAIETASKIQGEDYQRLRKAAEGARHLLTTQKYGAQFSQQHLRTYVVDQMNMNYKQSTETYGSEDSFLPKGLKYTLRTKFGGIRQKLVDVQTLVSSIEDLTNVFQQQTEEYKQKMEQKQAEGAEHQQWSSENIAKLLNMQYEQREQLEGYYQIKMGALQKILSIDNQTLEILPAVLREIEESLKVGKQFHHSKMAIAQQVAFAFPTELGMPFIYTHDRPILVHLDGKIRASANPQVSSGKYIRKPDTLESEFELRTLVSARVQGQLSFITPFDQQRYSAGYDRNFQLYLPLAGKIQMDLQKNQLRAEVESLQKESNTHLLHYSTWPYTSKNDIFTTEPSRQIIRKQHQQKINTVFGQKATGIALSFQLSSDKQMDVSWAYEKLQRHDLMSALLSPWVDEDIQNAEINIRVNSQQSTTQKLVAQLGYQQKYDADCQRENEVVDLKKIEEISEEPIRRQHEFLKRASANICNSRAQVIDATVQFQGEQQIKYVATLASAKSNVDAKGRALVQLKKSGGQSKPWQLLMAAKTLYPNTNGLDLTYAMEFDPTCTTQIEAAFGQDYVNSVMIEAQVQQRKSEERKQYLKEQPEYKECQRQMQQGNHQLPACAKMTLEANLLDHVQIKVDYKNMEPRVLNQTYKWYSLLRHVVYPRLDENIVDAQGTGKKQVEIEGRFTADLKHLNVKIQTEKYESHIKNMPVNQWAKTLLVSHPVFHIRSRLMGVAFNYDVKRPFCVVDKTAASTFDNKTYPMSLGNDWTVLLQYVPRRAPQQLGQEQQQSELWASQQIKNQVESYVVLARRVEEGSEKKEVKIVLQTPNTQGKLLEVTLKPAGSQQAPRVYINEEEIKYNTQQVSAIHRDSLEVYALPNGEVKAQIKNAFYVIFDGVRAKLTIVDQKFKDSTRGICGTFTGEYQTDFRSPKNCILRDAQQFIATYTVLLQGKQNQRITQLQELADKQCFQREQVLYANVISSVDAGRMRSDNERTSSRGSCTKLQTQYVIEGEDICFSLRPLPMCKSSCQASGTVSKQVAVHCVQQSGATDLWMNQIRKGASPDFSLKHQTRTIKMELPQRCSA